MGRTSKKYIHNAKSLRKYKKKELRDFIKENKLSIKRTSKLTKTEIVANLLRLQRNCGRTNKCMAQLPIKDKKKLSPLQQQALLKGQNAMRERRRLMKQEVTKEQKIDKRFSMVKDASIFDYVDKTPEIEEIDLFLKASKKSFCEASRC